MEIGIISILRNADKELTNKKKKGTTNSMGKGRLLLNDREYSLKPGDAILIKPNEKHQLLQKGSEPLGFICVVPNRVSRGKNEVDLSYSHES